MCFTKKDIRNKKITIIGLKKSGYSAAILADNFGAEVFVSDYMDNNDTRTNYDKLVKKGIQGEIGKHSDYIFNSNFWVISPGVPKDIDIIQKAEKLKIPIIGEIEFASKFTNKPIIAVTGSNGKSTTVNILFEMLKSGDYKPLLAGNIGKPFSKGVHDIINNLIKVDIIILEISSFQLEFIDEFQPYISLYLNITPDHLDRHNSMEEYLKMKLRMIKNMKEDDFIVYNKDDKIINESFKDATPNKISYSLKEKNKFFSLNKTKIYDDNLEPFIAIEDIPLKGKHNLSNLIASATVAKILNIKNKNIKSVMKQFAGIKHRLQFIRKLKEVTYINDSKATNISSVIAAIKSFNNPIVLLLGGKNKDSDFRLLLPHAKRHVKHIVSFGEAGGEIATAIGDAVRLNIMSSLNQAVASAHKIASPGDIILMSPGCASFDEFNNFEDRGEKFIAMVNELN